EKEEEKKKNQPARDTAYPTQLSNTSNTMPQGKLKTKIKIPDSIKRKSQHRIQASKSRVEKKRPKKPKKSSRDVLQAEVEKEIRKNIESDARIMARCSCLMIVVLVAVVALSFANPSVSRPTEYDGPKSLEELRADLWLDEPSPSGNTNTNTKTGMIEREEQTDNANNNKSSDTFEDKIRMISLNNPEYRVMGPNKTEVHMSDDVGSRIMVALLNMQEEASDLLKQVSGTVESGFNEFKDSAAKVAQSLEDMLSQRSSTAAKVSSGNKAQPTVVKSSQYDLYTTDGRSVKSPEALSMDEGAMAAPDDADEPKSGFKKFLDSVGLTDENQKKAEDALVKAGSATSDALSKATSATGDALSKAGTAIGDTITKDIPDTYKRSTVIEEEPKDTLHYTCITRFSQSSFASVYEC
ncbi:hypothetical protein GZH46_01725, partial [Fragariocoptes setiger]